MELTTLLRHGVVFIIFASTLYMNVEDNLIARLGITENYAVILCTAVIGTLVIVGRSAFFIAAIIVLSLNANMPPDFTLNLGYDRDLYAGMMMALLLQPVLVRAFD